jgi:hypothetical protein
VQEGLHILGLFARFWVHGNQDELLSLLIFDIEQVQIEEKLYTLRCMSYRVNMMQSGGSGMASVCVERLDH